MSDKSQPASEPPEHPYHAHVRNCESCSGPYGHCTEGLKLFRGEPPVSEGPTGCLDDGDALSQALRQISPERLNEILKEELGEHDRSSQSQPLPRPAGVNRESHELCRMPVDHVCWEKCNLATDDHYYPPVAPAEPDTSGLYGVGGEVYTFIHQMRNDLRRCDPSRPVMARRAQELLDKIGLHDEQVEEIARRVTEECKAELAAEARPPTPAEPSSGPDEPETVAVLPPIGEYDTEAPERIWIDSSGFDSSFWNDNGDSVGTTEYIRADLIPAQPSEAEPVAGFDLLAHLSRQREWSGRTFGPGNRTARVLDHIRKELLEIESAPADLSEWIDVVILAFDGAWGAGHLPHEIIAALVAKQARNEARDWPDWRTQPQDKAIEHKR